MVTSARCVLAAEPKVELIERNIALPEAEDMFAEQNVLNQAYQVVEHEAPIGHLKQEALKLLQSRGVFIPTSEDCLVSGCLARISEQSVRSFFIPIRTESSWTDEVADTISQAWLFWANNQASEAFDLLSSLRIRQSSQVGINQRSGAVNLMALNFWLTAVEFLIQGDSESSRRYWRRSIEVSGQFGSDSHPLITWSYVASFIQESISC
jgi:hypothetical protein